MDQKISNLTVDQVRANLEAAGLGKQKSSQSKGKSGGATATPGTTPSNDSFLANLQGTLMKQSEAISSSQSEIEKSISDAIGSVQGGLEASTARIESQAQRAEKTLLDRGSQRVIGANEARRGFATSTGILKQIYQDTDEQLKDLDMRKQELILQGESAAASKIADLQLQQLQFKQQASQQVFNNLISMANFGLAASQEERAQQQFDFDRQQAVGSIALEFGLDIRDGETMESIIDRAAPLATEERSIKLQQARKELELTNAQINKISTEGKVTDIESAARAAVMNPAILGNISDFDTLQKVINKMSEIESTEVIPQLVNSAIANGESLEEVINDIQSSSGIQNKQQAEALARQLYKTTSPVEAEKKLGDTTGSPLFDLFFGAGQAIEFAGSSIAGFVTGDRPEGFFNKIK